jgi:hypothetical protein
LGDPLVGRGDTQQRDLVISTSDELYR